MKSISTILTSLCIVILFASCNCMPQRRKSHSYVWVEKHPETKNTIESLPGINTIHSFYSSNLQQIKNIQYSNSEIVLKQVASPTSTPSLDPSPKGYVFDPCDEDQDCVDGRVCLISNTHENCKASKGGCLCYNPILPEEYQEFNISGGVENPIKYQSCEKCTDCLDYPNETCLQGLEDTSNDGICGSTYPVYLQILVETDCETYPHPSPFPLPFLKPNPSLELLPELSQELSQELSPERSPERSPELIPHPSTKPKIPPPPDTDDNPSFHALYDSLNTTCDEASCRTFNLTRPFKKSSSSPSPSNPLPPLPTPTHSPNRAACIGAATLNHLDRTNLVYKSHQVAQVICDEFNSCATPGHMVTYHGIAMTMKRYCSNSNIKCIKTVSHVNSPKFSSGLRIGSSTEHLYFTSFAARYETYLEEIALRFIIHVGL